MDFSNLIANRSVTPSSISLESINRSDLLNSVNNGFTDDQLMPLLTKKFSITENFIQLGRDKHLNSNTSTNNGYMNDQLMPSLTMKFGVNKINIASNVNEENQNNVDYSLKSIFSKNASELQRQV